MQIDAYSQQLQFISLVAEQRKSENNFEQKSGQSGSYAEPVDKVSLSKQVISNQANSVLDSQEIQFFQFALNTTPNSGIVSNQGATVLDQKEINFFESALQNNIPQAYAKTGYMSSSTNAHRPSVSYFSKVV